jgi:hypothetical protein
MGVGASTFDVGFIAFNYWPKRAVSGQTIHTIIGVPACINLRGINQLTIDENFSAAPVIDHSANLEIRKFAEGAFTPNLPPKFGVINYTAGVFRTTRKANGRYRFNRVNITEDADI